MRLALPSVFVLLFVPASALAQPTAPSPASPSAAASSLFAIPPPPPVDDPMLTPVPAPKRLLGSWQEALTYLRARSTDLRIALDQVLQAEAQTRIALAAYLPSINGTGTLTHNLVTTTITPGPQTENVSISGMPATIVISPPPGARSSTVPTATYLTGNIQATQAIINVQAFDQISIDELGEDAAKLSVDDEKRTLLLGVANEIVSVVTAEREAEINRVGLRVALEQLEITNRKRALGAANGLDVVRARQNAANARAALVTGDEALRETREALGVAIGIPEETGVARDINVDGMAQSAMASCRAVTGVDDRADVAAAHSRLAAAKRSLRNVYFQFLPTLTAASAVSNTGQPLNAFPSTTWNIQGILSVPIWDGGARYGLLRNARAAEDIAAQQLEALRRNAIIQVAQAQRQLLVAEESARVAREQRDLAAQNDQMTQAAYMAGQGTSLELVTASEAHRQAELNSALGEFNVVKARLLAMLALSTCPW
jgi:outer membrane protein, multidrug efflux system